MGVARIIFRGGGTLFQKKFQKILKNIQKIFKKLKIFQKYSKNFKKFSKNFLKKFAKNALF